MPITVATRRFELIKYNSTVKRAFNDTIIKYQEACMEILHAVRECWDEISAIDGDLNQKAYIENLIHKTKDNPTPRYPLFDLRLYKFPSYYRRAAIAAVLGAYSSYQTNLANYEKERYEAISNGKRFRKKPPKLVSIGMFPVLYNGQSVKHEENTLQIKVFIRNTWDWVTVNISNRDKKDFQKQLGFGKSLKPSLVYACGKYRLDVPFEYNNKLKEEVSLHGRRILAIDMGINTDAVCSVMRGDGTIESRHFIDLGSEKDSLNHIINKTRKVSRQSGVGQSLSHIYTKLDGIKDNHAKQLAARIRKLAVSENVDVVVLEYLGKLKTKNKGARIHHWCKKRMQDILCGELSRYGIRYSRVNPARTSKLAFDGSGLVVRDNDNYSLCTFSTGKQYNCDLNASYNIGARYFIREFIKPLDESQELQLRAKAPEVVKRTDCTLSTYRKIIA